MILRLMLAIIALCFSTVNFAYIVDGSRINQPQLISYARSKLQNYGTIQQTKQGFTYVKISDKYITELIKQISYPGYQLPKDGAHISVIQENEAAGKLALKEVGQTVHFQPLGFYTVVINDKEYFMLAVDAPELSVLRQRYGLPEKLANHAFHITIGVRELVAENELVVDGE